MSIDSCAPSERFRRIRALADAARSVKPPASVTPSSGLVSFSSAYAPGFTTSPRMNTDVTLGM